MSAKESHEQKFIETVKAIVEKNLGNDDFSIDVLCRELNLSRTHLYRKIKADTNLSTSLFIRKIRLGKARQLLEETDRNISEIAYLTGNKSPQNFSKYFIEAFGISPTAYRKQLKEIKKEEAPIKIPEAKRPNWTNWQKVSLFGLGLVLILVVSFVGKQWLDPTNTLSALVEPTATIAVIPFQNQSALRDDFLSEGIVEDILAKLVPIENLRVISKASTEPFKDTRKNIQQIGKSLGVDYLLTGKIRTEKDRILMNTELVRVKDNQLIWSERFTLAKSELVSIQSEVAERIAQALNQKLSPAAQQKLEKVPTSNPAAYTALLRGRHLMRSRTLDDLQKSKDQFLLAVDLDPQFSEAYEGIARTYHLMVNLGYASDQKKSYQEIAEKNALKAIQFDRTNGKAYAILGNLYIDQYRWEEAISAFEIALDLSPQDPMINYWFSLKLRSIGDLERSLKYHQIASELDPLHPVIQAGYIYTCALAGEFEKAENILREVEPLMINSFLFYFVKGNLLLRKGAFQEAISICEKALQLNSDFKSSESDKYYCLGKLGQKQMALDYIASLDKTKALDCLRAAKASMGIEEKEAAINYLKQAADLGIIDDDLIVEPIFSSLRTSPIFQEILEQYNLSPFAAEFAFDLN